MTPLIRMVDQSPATPFSASASPPSGRMLYIFPAPKHRSSSQTHGHYSWSMNRRKTKVTKNTALVVCSPQLIGYKLRTCRWLKIRNRDTGQVSPLCYHDTAEFCPHICCAPHLRRTCKRDAEDMPSVIQSHRGSRRAGFVALTTTAWRVQETRGCVLCANCDGVLNLATMSTPH